MRMSDTSLSENEWQEMSEFIEKSKQQMKTYVGCEVPAHESNKLKKHYNTKKTQSMKIKRKDQMWMLEKSWHYNKNLSQLL